MDLGKRLCFQQQRFIVRSRYNRCLEKSEARLYQYGQSLQTAGMRSGQVRQHGGRRAREAVCEVRYASVTVTLPARKQGEPVSLYYVRCEEKKSQREQGLCWHILTTEPVTEVMH